LSSNDQFTKSAADLLHLAASDNGDRLMTCTLPRLMAGNGNPAEVSFKDASRIIAEHASPRGIERIRLEDADGRVLAKKVIAQCMSPSTLVSAMDGYAVRDSDLAIMPASLRIAGQSIP